MVYRKANINDVNRFVENRLEFVLLIRKIENIDNFKMATKKYIEEHIEKDDLIIFLCMENEKIVSSCMASIFNLAPMPSNPRGKTAMLLNVYTKSEYRRQGHAEKLIGMLIDEIKKIGVGKITLDYTEDSIELYKKLGFKHAEKQMEMRL